MEKVELQDFEKDYIRDMILRSFCSVNEKIIRLKRKNEDGLFDPIIEDYEHLYEIYTNLLKKLSN